MSGYGMETMGTYREVISKRKRLATRKRKQITYGDPLEIRHLLQKPICPLHPLLPLALLQIPTPTPFHRAHEIAPVGAQAHKTRRLASVLGPRGFPRVLRDQPVEQRLFEAGGEIGPRGRGLVVRVVGVVGAEGDGERVEVADYVWVVLVEVGC